MAAGHWKHSLKIVLGLVASLALSLAISPAIAAPSKAQIESQYRHWLETDIWPEAKAAGVSRAAFDQAFAGVSINWKLPDLVIPGEKPSTPKEQKQAEFGAPGKYFNTKTIASVTSGGKARYGQYASLLKRIEQKYGVPGPILLAVWGRESGFGTVRIPYDAFEVLGTKAFMATRKDMFRKELIAALQIASKGYIDETAMKSSWAGALGQPQFMPTSYLKHAVDFDGDGKRDIWNSVPDALASIANYLKLHGWQKGRDWGFEVNVPQNVSCSLEGPDQGKTIAEWARLGITRTNGKPFPASEMKGEGYLLMPAGRYGSAFIVTPNFYVLKDYNMSDLYALFIGHVGDRIAYGAGDFSHGWDDVGSMYRSDIGAMQKRMQAQGYDVGKPDGLPGFKTRRSIGIWQAKNGSPSTCFPLSNMLNRIK
ncbi:MULTISPECIES: lytic murein transglycosylase [unclassified Brucella]|uniref:lytic murein transglycosylase n=1 Tax=unclassified Brucella TaxID=2632610 RepID=UPI0012ADFFC9|nr:MULTISPECIES: lytic murein transglycosylase [unclassified Brucella]MRN43842.1 lytic murein transglycosylase [Brucella sp. 09RB8913]MRN60164.1 lytic murein transglycosylase [Brucella sp. 09RB8918]CAB4326085.1 lytic murein transglycosylase [Brucella sp. 191011898]